MFKRQAHAFAHLLEALSPFEVALCPLCCGLFGEEHLVNTDGNSSEVTIEQAPPKLRTRLGRPRAVCLTHRDCNNANSYEARAGDHRKQLHRLARGKPARLPGLVDGRETLIPLVRDPRGVRPANPSWWNRDIRLSLLLPIDAQLAELKAAYLIAFAALGYSWATDAALDSVRTVLKTGDPASIGQIPLFVTRDPDPGMANLVLVSDDRQIVAVVGDDPHFGVLLPREGGRVCRDFR